MIIKENKNIGGGLLKLPPDNRDFGLEKVFGKIEKIPEDDFVVSHPLKIKDQGGTDMCVSFATCAVSEDQEEMELSPDFFFGMIKKVTGDRMAWGADLRSACKAAVRAGFLEEKLNPYQGKDRNFVANWEHWAGIHFEANAEKHRKKCYFKVGRYQTTSIAFRAALWANRGGSCSILTGVLWRTGWISAKNGIIPTEPSKPMFGHALKIFGQKKINGVIYLMAQLSNGEDVGDNGIFYFPENVINRDFTFGAYLFRDLDPNEAKQICWGRGRRILEKIKNTFNFFINEILK